jgi:hypothetical protein
MAFNEISLNLIRFNQVMAKYSLFIGVLIWYGNILYSQDEYFAWTFALVVWTVFAAVSCHVQVYTDALQLTFEVCL